MDADNSLTEQATMQVRNGGEGYFLPVGPQLLRTDLLADLVLPGRRRSWPDFVARF
jgi:hypothetical protein